MKLFFSFLLSLSLGAGSVPAAERGWFPPRMYISGSDQHYYDAISLPQKGEEFSVFLWQCPGSNPLIVGAQFGLTSKSLEILDLIPMPQFVNEGTMTSPILHHIDCLNDNRPCKPLAEVRLRLLDVTGGSLCYVLSDQLEINCSFNCIDESYYHHEAYGFRFGTGTPCSNTPWSDLCGDPLATETSSWGRIKSTFRD